MPYRLYDKAYRSPEELIVHLREKGLFINDEPKAKRFLEGVNYYRFKVYLYPFIDHPNESYRNGATFENGLELYRFDEELRNFIFSVICRIEIKLRSKLDQVIASHTSNPFWYLDDSIFSNSYSINNVRASLASQFQKSQDNFSQHFKDNYFNECNIHFKQLPPFWVVNELTTFGQILSIYSCLDMSKFRDEVSSINKLNTLAREFGASNIRELNGWIKAIRDVRNRCAHHSRVWNSNHRQASGIYNKLNSEYRPINNNKIYLFCALLKVINDNLGMDFEIKCELEKIFAKYPTAQSKSHSAGFPNNWFLDPFWE